MRVFLASTSETFGQTEGVLWFIGALVGIALIFGILLFTRRAHLLLNKELREAEEQLREKTP